MEQGVIKIEQQIKIAKEIDEAVLNLRVSNEYNGFQKAFLQASVIELIESRLTPEYMKPIMKNLQGKKVGFLTDRDKEANPGYTEEVVKNCVIEAVLMGLQVYGNQFNIIAGRMYPTKEGFSGMLRDLKVWYRLTHSSPLFNKETNTTSVTTKIEWKDKLGNAKTATVTNPIKVNSGMGSDAILGKAERKALKWLYTEITGNDVADGDANDVIAEVVESTVNKQQPQQVQPETQEAEEIKETTENFISAEEQAKVDARLQKATSKEDLISRFNAAVDYYKSKNLSVKIETYNLLLNNYSSL